MVHHLFALVVRCLEDELNALTLHLVSQPVEFWSSQHSWNIFQAPAEYSANDSEIHHIESR